MIDYNLQQIKTIEENDFYGKFSISPLNKGYGYTVGNTLRRILLSSLKGAAVTSVKIDGADHEYASLDGVLEDVINIMLNIKELKLFSRSNDIEKISISEKGEKIVRAKDINVSESIEVLDPDQIIATLTDSKSKLNIELEVETSYGYKLIDNKKRSYVGVIPLDADFSPVKIVNFQVVNTRVGENTDLDELVIEIYTKSINPTLALKNALEEACNVFNNLNEQINIPVIKEAKVKKTKTVKAVKDIDKDKKVKTTKVKKDETPKKSKKTK
jgi:DNA-directed RNA polymerase subunit alpha